MGLRHLSSFKLTLIFILSLIITSVNLVTGQITTPCTTSMINTITPCANFITGSTNNIRNFTPSSMCCDSLLSLIRTSVDCTCLIITANVPIQLPINTVLSLLLPQACNVKEMPALCKASGVPLPAPGPAVLGSNDQTLPPIAVSPLSPQVSNTIVEVEAPKSEIVQPALAPASVELTPTKQKHPRKLQELDQYFSLPN